jgi:hypothetical protein
MKNRIAIVVEGGVVQGVFADFTDDIEVSIVDHDTLDTGDCTQAYSDHCQSLIKDIDDDKLVMATVL